MFSWRNGRWLVSPFWHEHLVQLPRDPPTNTPSRTSYASIVRKEVEGARQLLLQVKRNRRPAALTVVVTITATLAMLLRTYGSHDASVTLHFLYIARCSCTFEVSRWLS